MTQTRKKQIEYAAGQYFNPMKDSTSFIAGAKWADEHPYWRNFETDKPTKKGEYLIIVRFDKEDEQTFYFIGDWDNSGKFYNNESKVHFPRTNAEVLAWTDMPKYEF